MIIKFTIILFATVITVQGASTGEFGNITTTTETTTETTTKNFETTASTTGTTESTIELSNTTDLFTGVSTTASTTNDYSSTVSSTGTPEASFRTTTGLLTTISSTGSTASTTADGSTTTTTKTTTETTTQNFETTVSTTGATESTSEFSTINDYSSTVSSTGTPEASVSSTTDLLTTISGTRSTASSTADSTSDSSTSSPESSTLTSTRDDQSTTFSTTATSESSTETSPTASTRQNQTKWRSSYISTMTTIIPTTTTENPIDEIKQLYNEIKNATVHGLIQTRAFIEQIFRFPITFTSNVIKNIFKISFEFFEKLNKLNLKYIKFGVDISSCIELVLPGFAELPLILAKQLTECIKPEIDVVSNDLFTTVRNVTTLWNVVLDLGIELDNCGTNSSCLTDLISRITAEFIEIPTTITTDLLRIQQYLDNTTILTETCAESKFSAAITNGTEAIKNVTDCARKIFS